MKSIIFLFLTTFLLLSGCSSSNTNATTTTPETFLSEEILNSYSFETSNEWTILYSGACDLNLSASASQDGTSALFTTNRANNYDGPALNLGNKIEPNTTYVIRGYIKRASSNNDTYNLNLKLGSNTYIQLNRILVDNDEWTKFRAFIRLNETQLQNDVYLYINSDALSEDFYLDNVELVTSTYTPPATPTDSIIKTSYNVRLKGINLTAYLDDNEDANSIYTYAYMNYDKSDLLKLKEIGFNSLRLNLWYKLFEDDTNPMVLKDDGLAWLDTIIGWAKEAELYVVLDMHAPQGGSFQGPANVTPFWNDAIYQERFIWLWEQLAKRYKNEPSVIAYDLINEPCPNSESEYQALLSRTISAVRAVDANHIINVETSFAPDASPFILTNTSNILYDFHFYDPWSSFTDDPTAIYGTNTLNDTTIRTLFEDYISLYKQEGVPFQVSEFGQKSANFNDKNSSAWVSDVIELLDENNASYHYFTFKGNFFGLYDGENKFAENSTRNDTLYNLLLDALK